VRSAEAAWEEAQDIGLPVVVKPVDGNHGRGVSLNLMTEADVQRRLCDRVRRATAAPCWSSASFRQRAPPAGGRPKVVAAARGESLWVTGDGNPTCRAVRQPDQHRPAPRRSRRAFPLSPSCAGRGDEILLDLKRQGLTPASCRRPARKC
jgi:cyanophycin synthetase